MSRPISYFSALENFFKKLNYNRLNEFHKTKVTDLHNLASEEIKT